MSLSFDVNDEPLHSVSEFAFGKMLSVPAKSRLIPRST